MERVCTLNESDDFDNAFDLVERSQRVVERRENVHRRPFRRVVARLNVSFQFAFSQPTGNELAVFYRQMTSQVRPAVYDNNRLICAFGSRRSGERNLVSG